jgi:hypothetical protein
MMKDVMNTFPNSDQALRAQLAIAMLYEDYKGEEALAMYREMVDKHPESPFSKRGKEILEAIEKAKLNAEKKKKDAALEEERQKKAEEDAKKREQRYRNPLLDEELRVARDSARTEDVKVDPTLDEDFPLRLPGDDKPPVEDPVKDPLEDSVSGPPKRSTTRNPDSIDPTSIPGGDTLRRLTPPIPIKR